MAEPGIFKASDSYLTTKDLITQGVARLLIQIMGRSQRPGVEGSITGQNQIRAMIRHVSLAR